MAYFQVRTVSFGSVSPQKIILRFAPQLRVPDLGREVPLESSELWKDKLVKNIVTKDGEKKYSKLYDDYTVHIPSVKLTFCLWK